jgi:hypothetical protein
MDYIFRQSYSTHVEVKVKADDALEATRKGKTAIANLDPDDFTRQLQNNRSRTDTSTKEVI